MSKSADSSWCGVAIRFPSNEYVHAWYGQTMEPPSKRPSFCVHRIDPRCRHVLWKALRLPFRSLVRTMFCPPIATIL